MHLTRLTHKASKCMRPRYDRTGGLVKERLHPEAQRETFKYFSTIKFGACLLVVAVVSRGYVASTVIYIYKK